MSPTKSTVVWKAPAARWTAPAPCVKTRVSSARTRACAPRRRARRTQGLASRATSIVLNGQPWGMPQRCGSAVPRPFANQRRSERPSMNRA
eukprot:3392697-Lingulodinium_polyedra.AAC.1